jgi:hypothetical protein
LNRREHHPTARRINAFRHALRACELLDRSAILGREVCGKDTSKRAMIAFDAHDACCGHTQIARAEVRYVRCTANLEGKKREMRRLSHTLLSQTGLAFGRSFWPLLAIVVIAGAMIWGPWVSLAITVVAVAAALRLI